ncbi:MAG: metallophosphoesterase, partial [Spirochaetaceae bacterium]|nr:metallophosphoesterase [Spirochaetaceae bacterium]
MTKLRCALIVAYCILCASCGADVLGFFYSTDLDKRLEAAHEFHFIKDQWRNGLSTGDEYSFIVISDTHITGTKANGFENIKTRLEDAKFVVVTGDITQNGAREEITRFI